MTMKPEGWELRLAAEVEAAKSRGWQWGVHDCASFAHSCMKAMADGGPTPFDDLIGQWHDLRSAADRVAEWGGMLEVVGRALPEIPWQMAQRGDLAAFHGEGIGGAALGIVDGVGAWCAAEPRGLMRAPMAVALRAWAVR